MGYWLVVLGEVDGLRWVMANRRMAFTAVRQSLATKIQLGDRLIVYVGRGAYHNPTRDRSQIIGVATVRTRVRGLRMPLKIGGREFVCDCGLKIDIALPERNGVPIQPLIRKLSFVKRPEVWGQYFRSSLAPLSTSDFRLLENAVMKCSRGLARHGVGFDD